MDTRESLLRRYNEFGIKFPSTSFLLTSEQRLEVHSAGGRHLVKVQISRRNHKVVQPMELKNQLPRLRLLLTNLGVNDCVTYQFTKPDGPGVSLNGYSIRIGQWFLYDDEDTFHSKPTFGKILAVFACTFGAGPARPAPPNALQCFVEMQTYNPTTCTKLNEFKDYTLDETKTRECKVKVIPLKCLHSVFWKVPHWDPTIYPPRSCLLLIKNL